MAAADGVVVGKPPTVVLKGEGDASPAAAVRSCALYFSFHCSTSSVSSCTLVLSSLTSSGKPALLSPTVDSRFFQAARFYKKK